MRLVQLARSTAESFLALHFAREDGGDTDAAGDASALDVLAEELARKQRELDALESQEAAYMADEGADEGADEKTKVRLTLARVRRNKQREELISELVALQDHIDDANRRAGGGTRLGRSISPPMAVNSISSGSPHVRCTPMWALSTCGEPDEIKKNTHPKWFTARIRDQVVAVVEGWTRWRRAWWRACWRRRKQVGSGSAKPGGPWHRRACSVHR